MRMLKESGAKQNRTTFAIAKSPQPENLVVVERAAEFLPADPKTSHFFIFFFFKFVKVEF